MIVVKELPGRGRGVVTTDLVKGGQPILEEPPLVITVAQEYKDAACAACLKLLHPGPGQPSCGACQQVAFCSTACFEQAGASPWLHAPATCRAYGSLAGLGGDPEAAAALRFLIQAAALRALAASGGDARYQQLLALVGDPDAAASAQAARLQPLLAQAIGDASVSQAEVAALLAKESLNSFGILAPLGPRGERRLRGGAIYPRCALVNHECAPNAARFDQFDQAAGAGPVNTAVQIRAMHDLPPGTEVTLSYVPLNWSLQERQEQLQQVYGFRCSCPRCQTEASDAWAADAGGSGSGDGDGSGSDWETDSADAEEAGGAEEGVQLGGGVDHDMAAAHGLGAAAAGPGHSSAAARAAAGTGSGAAAAAQLPPGPPGAGEPPLDPTYLQLFLLKFLCPRRHCFGSMAPLGPGSDVCECNVCGGRRSEAQFLADLEEGRG